MPPDLMPSRDNPQRHHCAEPRGLSSRVRDPTVVRSHERTASYSDPARSLRVPKDEEQTCRVFDLAGECRLSAISPRTLMKTDGQKPVQSTSGVIPWKASVWAGQTTSIRLSSRANSGSTCISAAMAGEPRKNMLAAIVSADGLFQFSIRIIPKSP